MRFVTFYHAETGVLNGVTCLLSDDSAVELNERLYAGHKAIDHPQGAQLNHLLHQVDVTTVTTDEVTGITTGKVVARTAPLPAPAAALELPTSCPCPRHRGS